MSFVFKIKIKGITKPPVWRRLLVPGFFTFSRFHEVIQLAFGWENYHLYKFSDKPYGGSFEIKEKDEDFDEGFDIPFFNPIRNIDADKTKLSDFFSEENQKLVYLYDFGDDWEHDIKLEEIREGEPINAICLQGKGACPPEDVGGAMGYEGMKEIFIEDPDSDEAEDYLGWLGCDSVEDFDPKEFDLKLVNEMLEEA